MEKTPQRRGMTLIEVLVLITILIYVLAGGTIFVYLLWDWRNVVEELRQTELWQWMLFIAFFVGMRWWQKQDSKFK